MDVLAYLKSYLVNQQSTVVAIVCNSTMGRYSRTALEMSLIRAFRRQMLSQAWPTQWVPVSRKSPRWKRSFSSYLCCKGRRTRMGMEVRTDTHHCSMKWSYQTPASHSMDNSSELQLFLRPMVYFLLAYKKAVERLAGATGFINDNSHEKRAQRMNWCCKHHWWGIFCWWLSQRADWAFPTSL